MKIPLWVALWKYRILLERAGWVTAKGDHFEGHCEGQNAAVESQWGLVPASESYCFA